MQPIENWGLVVAAVKRLRIEKGLTVRQFAKMCCVSFSTMIRFEQCDVVPSLRSFLSILNAYVALDGNAISLLDIIYKSEEFNVE